MDNNEENSPQLLQQRANKHKQILKMIHGYKRTPEDIRAMDKLRNATKMEINLRFLKSSHNKQYSFPRKNSDDNDDDTFQQQFPTTPALYDLQAQKPIIEKTISNQNISIDSRRRVKSLQRQRTQNEEVGLAKKARQKIFNINPHIKSQGRSIRKNSLSDKKNTRSAVKLPELKPIQTKSTKKVGLQEVIGRKIATESSPDQKTYQKYLKNLQFANTHAKPKKFFLQDN